MTVLPVIGPVSSMEARSVRPGCAASEESDTLPAAATGPLTVSSLLVCSNRSPVVVNVPKFFMKLLARLVPNDRSRLAAWPLTVPARASAPPWVMAAEDSRRRLGMPTVPRSTVSPGRAMAMSPAVGVLPAPSVPSCSVAATTRPSSAVVSDRPVAGLAPLVSSTGLPAV